MVKKFTAIYKKCGNWYSGWVAEVPGANTQGKTLAETKKNLKEALALILETDKSLAKDLAKNGITRESISVPIG
jgi:predicted RNase H-like HicB family nuclease